MTWIGDDNGVNIRKFTHTLYKHNHINININTVLPNKVILIIFSHTHLPGSLFSSFVLYRTNLFRREMLLVEILLNLITISSTNLLTIIQFSIQPKCFATKYCYRIHWQTQRLNNVHSISASIIKIKAIKNQVANCGVCW